MQKLNPLALAAAVAWAPAAWADEPEPGKEVASATLSAVTARASSDASAAGLSPAYPGGQVARGGRAGIRTQLSDADRWALAFLVSGLRTESGEPLSGRKLWDAGQGREEFRDYRVLVTKPPAEVAAAVVG